MIQEYLALSYKNAKTRKLRSLLTMIGIFAGIAAVVSLISLSSGMQTAISDIFVGLGTDKIIVRASGGGFGPPGTGIAVYLTEDDEKIINKIDGVKQSFARLIRTVKVSNGEQERFVYGVTVPDESENIKLVVEANDYQIKTGQFLDSKSDLEVVLGNNLAKTLFEEEILKGDKITIQDKKFKVIGILKKSGSPQKDDSLVIPEKYMREILNIKDDVDVIIAKVLSSEDVPIVSEKIKKELRRHRNLEEGKEDFTISTPGQLLDSLTNILMIIQGILVSIAAISLLVGGIGIMNTMYTSVIERTKEIGILKSVGATENKILSLFLLESGILGLMGGLIGVLIGIIIAKTIEIISTSYFENNLIQAEFSFLLIGGTLLFSFLIGTLSGFLPAKQAAKLDPIEAMRNKK